MFWQENGKNRAKSTGWGTRIRTWINGVRVRLLALMRQRFFS
jgi:hypothetical protein